MSKVDVEARLLAAFGATQMVWAKGIKGQDITDYHIDSLARFVGQDQVLIQLPHAPDPADPWSIAAFETYDALKAAKLDVTVIAEPTNPRIKSYDFVATYANYYVCNGAVITAEFGDRKTDKIAKTALQNLYPGREVITLNVDTLGELGGGIHCATQQQPAT